MRFGYAETNIEEVAMLCGVAKQTVYNHFSDKEQLFKAVIAHLLSESVPEELKIEWYALEPEAFFHKIGKVQLKFLNERKTTELLRLTVKECRRFPELQEVYAKLVPAPFIDFVATYLLEALPGPAAGNREQDIVAAQTDTTALSSAQAASWCFRAALTGYATLTNLSRYLDFKLPTKTAYLTFLGKLFASFCRSDSFFQRMDDFRSAASDKVNLSEVSLSPAEIRSFLESVSIGSKQLEIVAAAIQVFSLRGFSDASLSEVNALAGVSKQTLYKHFPGKNLLYSYASKAVLDGMRKSILLRGKIDPKEFLATFLERQVALFEHSWLREFLRVNVGEAQSFPAEAALVLVFIFSCDRTTLENSMRCAGLSATDALSASIMVHSLSGTYILLRQIFLIGSLPYFDTGSLNVLISLLLSLLDKVRINAESGGNSLFDG